MPGYIPYTLAGYTFILYSAVHLLILDFGCTWFLGTLNLMFSVKLDLKNLFHIQGHFLIKKIKKMEHIFLYL